jgi:hypothetical protein
VVTNSGDVLHASLATGGVLTAILIPYKTYAFHFDWAKLASVVVYVLFAALGVAAGFGGYEACAAIGWRPVPGSSIVTGVIYGAFGQAAVRVRLDRIPGGDAADALTLLSAAGDWLAGVLDVQIPRAVRRQLAKLPPGELAQYVDHLYKLRVESDGDLSEAAIKGFGRRVDSSVNDVAFGEEAAKDRARTTLRALGEQWVMHYEFDRPRRA